jgi:hypothetical protein
MSIQAQTTQNPLQETYQYLLIKDYRSYPLTEMYSTTTPNYTKQHCKKVDTDIN